MNKVKILHCADLHIGATAAMLGEKGQTRRFETLITFENIIRLAKDNAVNIILIAGDLFCSNSVERSAVNRTVECIGSVPDIKVVFAAGNHDPLNSSSPFFNMRLPENFCILPDTDSFVYFETLGTKVYGRSFFDVYMQGEARFALKPTDDSINILCQHGELKSDLSSNYNSITGEFIDNCGMDYIALGHIHKRSDIMRRGNTFFAYSGCAEGLGFDELGEKGVYIGSIGKGICELEFFRTSVRTHEMVEIDVSDCEDNPSAAEKVISVLKNKYGDLFADNLYKIILTGDIPEGSFFDTNEITSRLSSMLYFVKVKDCTEVLKDLEIIKNENSLKGVFVSRMLKRIAEEPENQTLRMALNLGIKAFSSEVLYNEDQ
ncbi:MAG: DNA repair exonuclease [Clostridia bacterium]|nr:DNA repair exonuclease [Clostridia bacterium]